MSEWMAKMVLGFVCFWIVIAWPFSLRGVWWLLPWAGFYAYDTGYSDWKQRTEAKKKEPRNSENSGALGERA